MRNLELSITTECPKAHVIGGKGKKGSLQANDTDVAIKVEGGDVAISATNTVLLVAQYSSPIGIRGVCRIEYRARKFLL